MFESVLLIGVVLTVAMLILSFLVVKATPKAKFASYYPSTGLFIVGLLFLGLAPIVEKTVIMGAGLGGWGIACLFAAFISVIITIFLDTFQQDHANA